ncbi:phosphoserine phosphatase SerB [Ahrensia sp. R2A130]|uniref:phosphoserine phosphatase SerB n=1 Tax=Ahrensia sp. R2A130 TaxID=744979 RepID=UPI0001E0BC51|nr:phosphoserine phosphatase SerB [Ahrensia sp. R2A130]EFL90771.1 phosphoserine phosphatase SerB [Ahrensia sp. R2A130]
MSERVATLIANPANPCLTPELADTARDAIGASGVYFLADGIACDLPLNTASGDRDAILAALNGAAIDVVVQDADNRRKSVLLADMDSTMIQQECIDELAVVAGIGEQVATITAAAMRGEVDFEDAFRERLALLGGQPDTIVDDVLNSRIDPMPGGAQLVGTMKANGAYCALVSGGFTAFTSAIAEKLGFDENRANILESHNGKLTGQAVDPILGKEAKAIALNEIISARGLTADDVMAVGDGANDLDMLTLAGSGVALHAKPVVAEQAKFRIDHGDLTALLYIQGYRKADFVG